MAQGILLDRSKVLEVKVEEDHYDVQGNNNSPHI